MKKHSLLKSIYVLVFFALFSFLSVFTSISSARYVKEIGNSTGGGINDSYSDIPYEIVTPVLVQTEGELTDALVNGYSLVQLDEELTDPVIMTGNSLNLVRDLILDLNGNEIQSNNIDSLLNIPNGRVLTIIDSAGGGGLYNPIGSVLQIDGGKLQVYGGKVESGPRASEYYSKSTNVISGVGSVTPVKGFSSTDVLMPIIIPRLINGINNGNIYFDSNYTLGSKTINSDTYLYMYVEDTKYNQQISSLDLTSSDFAYSYTLYKDELGNYSTSGTVANAVKVTILGYENVISKTDISNTMYASVIMKSGLLEIGVRGTAEVNEVTQAGSFYSYFGKQNTSCVYFTGGTMQVETTGEFKTINPSDVPDGTLAKNSEGSCIICDEHVTRQNSGTLNITNAICTAYNGSIIEMKGGTLNVSSAKFSKQSSMHHATNPQDGNAKYDSALYIEDGEMTLSNAQIDISSESYSYGILAKGSDNGSSAKLNCTNVNYTLSGTNTYGIYATHGVINIDNGEFNLTNNKSCYGVYAVTRSAISPVEIDLKDTKIKIGEQTMFASSTENGRIIPACVGVYLNSTEFSGGKVNLDNVNIECVEIGVAVNSGTLTLKNGGNIKTYNASAIALRSGDVNFENNSTSQTPTEYIINSEINRKSAEATTSAVTSSTIATNAGLHLYERTLPWLANEHDLDPSVDEKYTNNDSIYVNGGNLTADGKLNITHRGLYNNYEGVYDVDQYNYNKLIIKSFAVLVAGGTVNIKYANITNSVGGGVKVSGGKAVLGSEENSTVNDVIINTTGTAYYSNILYFPVTYFNRPLYNKWRFHPSLSGGYAITARGGNLEIYNGKYTASYASAILASEQGKIDIHDGEFKGYMKNGETDIAVSGPASHYGIKITGQATINITGGKFDGKNGGAFINGKNKQERANVYIYKGYFGTTTGDSGLDSQDGFNVYDNSTVYFGAYTQAQQLENGITDNTAAQNAIVIRANTFPIAVNPIKQPTSADKTITDIHVYVYYGTYVSSRNYATGAIDSTTYATFDVYGIGSYVNTKQVNGAYVRYTKDSASIMADAVITTSTEIKYFPYPS